MDVFTTAAPFSLSTPLTTHENLYTYPNLPIHMNVVLGQHSPLIRETIQSRDQP